MPRVLVLVVLATLSASCSRACGDDPTLDDLSFHHLHLRVADPAAAMERYYRDHECEKLILQGVGVGVRCADAYLLFERNLLASEYPVAPVHVSVTGVGETARIVARVAVEDPASAAAWMAEHFGPVAATATTFVDRSDGAAFDDVLAHLAFGTSDPGPVLTSLEDAGVRPLVEGPESVIVEGPGGLPVEVVHDAGSGPDAFWCPMHPDVRAPQAGTCPICRMTLVPMPEPVYGDYGMTVTYEAATPSTGRLTLRVLHPETTEAVSSFHEIHERLLHLFIVGRALDTFEHVHPELQDDGRFTLEVTWPKPDAYAVYADFYPAGGTPQLLQRTIVTPDYRGNPFPAAPEIEPDADTPKTVGTTRVALDALGLVAGIEQLLEFTLSDADTGDPVADLVPYLGAPGHLMVVSADLADVVHSHPSDVSSTGPTVTFDALFPRAGAYKMWAQFQRRGEVMTVPFTVSVGPG